MRIAIFSDIHGNLQALNATLADIAAQKPDAIYCLGDLVGYGAAPNEVTERIRQEAFPTVMGTMTTGLDSSGMNAAALTAKRPSGFSATDRWPGRKRRRPRRTRRT